MQRPMPFWSPLVLALFFSLYAAPTLLDARELVTCRYLTASGTTIQLEISVGTPPPATLIVIQQLPPGVNVVGSSPAVKKFSQKDGEAKWLIMGLRTGTTILAMTLDTPVSAGQLSGEMRYNDAVSGELMRLPFTP